jgi:hypothetical protein
MLRVFENRVLRKIFGHQRDKLTGYWRRLHNEKLYCPYYSPNDIQLTKSRTMRHEGHATLNGGEEKCMRNFGGEPERKR